MILMCSFHEVSHTDELLPLNDPGQVETSPPTSHFACFVSLPLEQALVSSPF